MLETITKVCTKCNCEKEISEYNNSNRTKDGKNNHCKECTRKYQDSVKDRYVEKNRIKYHKNKEEISKQRREKYKEDSKNREKILAQVKNYRDANKDKLLERNRRYRANNKEKVALSQKAYQRDRYLKKTEEILERNRNYRLNNLEKVKKYHREYSKTEKGKAIQRNAHSLRRLRREEGDVTTAQMVKLQKIKICYWCKCKIKRNDLNIDHYTPISKGGKHTISNLVASCSKCNLDKRAKDPQKYANSLGRLL